VEQEKFSFEGRSGRKRGSAVSRNSGANFEKKMFVSQKEAK
jgi:hypothetical protein